MLGILTMRFLPATRRRGECKLFLLPASRRAALVLRVANILIGKLSCHTGRHAPVDSVLLVQGIPALRFYALHFFARGGCVDW